MDFENYFKRLIILNSRGCYLTFASGHTWIEQDSDFEGPSVVMGLITGNVSLNNKIYGGIFQAIDTIDTALQAAGEKPLLELWDDDIHRLGNGGVAHNRIKTNVDEYAGLV